MDTYSSGENFNIKTRKPYTITKQRERWTEDEHNSFLEALKLYGRAWQRIEEHIGTKTAVQIRSHAQKFFTKLEKEAVAKGVPVREAIDIEIPPPRPKRKPTFPYPRKTGPINHSQLAEDKEQGKQSASCCLQSGGGIEIPILDLEKKPPLPEQTCSRHDEAAKTTSGVQVEHEAPCGSSENERSTVFREFIPSPSLVEEEVNHNNNKEETIESCYITTIQETTKHVQTSEQHGKHTSNTSSLLFESRSHVTHEHMIEGGNSNKLSQAVGAMSMNDSVHNCSYPRHVPVQLVDPNIQQPAVGVSVPPDMSLFPEPTPANNKSFVNMSTSAATASTTSYQTLPTFHPLYTHNQLVHVSSSISSLIVSSLLQNPAAHAAATFAATFWHPEAASGDSSSSARDDLNSPPTMAAIAGATVAAATAWWAAHGLLPAVSTPFYHPPGFSFGTPPITEANNGTQDDTHHHSPDKNMDHDDDALKGEHQHPHPPAATAADLSSSEEDSGGRAGDSPQLSPADVAVTVGEEDLLCLHHHDDSRKDTNNINVGGKQVDRSSCGSNTTSSSEIETDALEKKVITHGIENEQVKGGSTTDANLLSCNNNDSLSRIRTSNRSTAIANPNDSWKEVSEEGRLAFQALFSRQVLPQSFSKKMVSELDLNSEADKNVEEGLLTMGLGSGMKLKVHHTGFKPYKRCSVEAKETKAVNAADNNQNDEKSPKRMRLEAEAST